MTSLSGSLVPGIALVAGLVAIKLRAEVKRASNYLRTGDRPDASEARERLDALLAELREEADAKRRDTE